MEKDSLQSLIEQGLSQREMAKITGLSHTTIRHWLAKYGLNTKTNSKPEFYKCIICGDNDPLNFYKSCGGSWCKECHNRKCIQNQRKRKQQFVDYKGGHCERCGYNKCLGALEFHHLDPKEKDPDWSKLKSKSLENAKPELDKCALVCSRCHREIHWEEANKRRGLT